MKKGIFGFSVRDIAEIAMLSSLAILLDSFVKIPLGATGGSINIAMLPLIIIAIRHGWFKTLIAGGIVFGLTTCLLDGYGIATYPFEYLVPFGSLALISLFGRYINNRSNNVILRLCLISGVLLIVLGIRFFFASLDSVILWEYTWEAAFIYNLGYVFISGISCMVLTILLFPVIDIINNRFKSDYITYIESTL